MTKQERKAEEGQMRTYREGGGQDGTKIRRASAGYEAETNLYN